MKRDLDRIVAALSLEEKASLCSGRDFWNTKSVERLGVFSWMMADGPHGLRKQIHDASEAGLRESAPATCFPSGSGLAATWDRELVEEVGQAIGREAKAMQVGIVLGPAVNIKRSPLCGRSFEYLSEDPYLAGELAKRHIMGLQSQGVGSSIKHFAANNQEKARMSIDAIVDERSLREIYLPAFESAVKEAQPWTVMCAYNRLNGSFCSENAWLLDRVLKREWGHTGIVLTDWGACADRVEGLKSGQDLDMPGDGGITDAEIVAAVEDGSLDEAVLDASVRRILEVSFRVLDNLSPAASFDPSAHHELARRVAAEGFVLLKNEGGLLPLAGRGRVAFIGEFARHPRYQGGGSSHVNPTRLDDALEEARKLRGDRGIDFAPGYSLSGEEPDPALESEAAELAATAAAAVLFVGLPESWESEGFDRSSLGIPKSHLSLIERIASVQKNLVVVLSNGAPIEMPWLDKAPAVLETYLGGQAWGGAVADILFGLRSPSGKLAETFPRRLEDNPSYLNFPGEERRVEYREGLFVGYRYYDAARVEPLFPFGHGLSYSRFSYSALSLDRDRLRDTETLGIGLELENSGPLEAKEVVQLYVGDEASSVRRPPRELKAFAKVSLRPGERKSLRFGLGKRAFAFWSPEHGDWVVESGFFEIAVGSSSRDIRLRARVFVESSAPDLRAWDSDATLGELERHPLGAGFVAAIRPRFEAAYGSFEPGSMEALANDAFLADMPLRNLVRMGLVISQAELDSLLEALNGEKGRARL